MERKTFVLHDESVNTHGFRMLTGGCDLSVFRQNPVMFYNHEDWSLPIGRWENIRVEEDRILAEAVFDVGDERALTVMRKVESGFLKAASIGAWVHEYSDSPELRLEGQTAQTVVRWTAREASICPIGANHHAVALYDGDGVRVELSAVPGYGVPPSGEEGVNDILKGDRKMFNLRSLFKLNESATEEAVAEEVRKLMDAKDSLESANAALSAENAALKEEKAVREAAEKERRDAEALSMVDAAISEGRIDGRSREVWLSAFASDHEGSKLRLESIPRRRSIASQVSGMSAASGLHDKTWDELDRCGGLPRLREEDPGLYAEKYEAKFGVRPEA